MNTNNQKFICYAKEYFDGRDADYEVAIYDSDEEPKLDTASPNFSLNIMLEGSLNNPFDAQALKRFMQQYLGRNSLDFSASEAVSATEAGIVDTIKNKVSTMVNKHQVKKSEKEGYNLKPVYETNLENIETAIKTQKASEAKIKPQEAVRYYLSTLSEETGAVKFFILLHQATKRTAIDLVTPNSSAIEDYIARYAVADTSEEAKKQVKSAYMSAASAMLSTIKKSTSENTIIGYTLDAKQAKKFEQSLSTSFNEKLRSDPAALNAAIAAASNSSLKIDILNKAIGLNASKVPPEVKATFLKVKDPFTSLAWTLLQHYLNSGASKEISAEAYQYIMSSSILIKLFKSKGLKGIDLTTQTQITVILAALKLNNTQSDSDNYIDLIFDSSKRQWKSPKSMAQIYKKEIEPKLKDTEQQDTDSAIRRGSSTKPTGSTQDTNEKAIKAILDKMLKDGTLTEFLLKNGYISTK